MSDSGSTKTGHVFIKLAEMSFQFKCCKLFAIVHFTFCYIRAVRSTIKYIVNPFTCMAVIHTFVCHPEPPHGRQEQVPRQE